jgi:hypothetical protein
MPVIGRPLESMLRFLIEGAPELDARRREREGRELQTNRETSSRRAAMKSVKRDRVAAGNRVYNADYGRNLARSYALQTMGITPLQMQLAQRQRAMSGAGITP